MRRIAVITGARAEYGILQPVIDRLDYSPNIDARVVVTGMHLSPHHGLTRKDIERDGFRIAATVDMLLSSDTLAGMGKSVGIGIYGLCSELETLAPDVVLVLGDRIEAFAGAVAGLFCGSCVAHIHGGELTQGGVDEYLRHAITKLSHIHFAATELAKQRILHLGEHPEFVFHTGTPGLDALLRYKQFSDEDLSRAIGFTLPERYILVVQHPISTQSDSAAEEMNATLEALREVGLPVILAYPNADAGYSGMADVIRHYEGEDWLRTYTHFPRDIYANLLRRAAVLVGNSSSGMIDSAAFGVPVVNIGDRQAGRERGANVLDAPPERDEIYQTVKRALEDTAFIEQARQAVNPYGDGTASLKIAAALETFDPHRAKKLKRLPW